MPARDYSAFSEPVTKEQVAEFRRAARAAGRSSSNAVGLVVLIVVGALFLIFAGVIASLFVSISSSTSAGSPAIIPVAVVAVALVIAVICLVAVFATRARWERRLRQSHFAETNGLAFSSGDRPPGYQGAIFGIGGSRRVEEHFFATSGRSVDFGNYQYTTGSGKNRTTHRWGFLAMRLDRNLPHMVLDSTANNGLFGATNLPASFSRDQVLSLEGDFDDYFRLYCPNQYERDALYVFTPDLMALLIDNAAAFDVEIVDDWMFVYSSTTIPMNDPASIEQLLRIVDTVGAKTLSQTDRYSDDRMMSRSQAGFAPSSPDAARSDASLPVPQATGSIGAGGRRLRRRFPIAGAIVVVGVIAFQIARVALDRF